MVNSYFHFEHSVIIIIYSELCYLHYYESISFIFIGLTPSQISCKVNMEGSRKGLNAESLVCGFDNVDVFLTSGRVYYKLILPVDS